MLLVAMFAVIGELLWFHQIVLGWIVLLALVWVVGALGRESRRLQRRGRERKNWRTW